MSKERLLSLDIFRGATIAFMIVVNTPGSWRHIYPPLRHAAWHGCTPTDLVFPAFLFIVGVSLWYSMKRYSHSLNAASLFRITRRTLLLFAAGLFLAIFPDFTRDYSTLRIMGVLQRIALAYFLAAIIVLTIKRDYIWITIAVILLLYWALLWLFGGTDPYSAEGSLVTRIDRLILGESRMYRGFGLPFEPEGLLSTIPASATVLLGYLTGSITGRRAPSGATLLQLLIYGAGLTGLGLLWGLFFPINKPLWTSSYVLYTGGISMLILALCYLMADLLKFRKWGTPFIVMGVNALFVYMMAGVWTKIMLRIRVPSGEQTISLYNWIYTKICVPLAGNLNGSLMFAILQVLLLWLLAYLLYRRKIYIKV